MIGVCLVWLLMTFVATMAADEGGEEMIFFGEKLSWEEFGARKTRIEEVTSKGKWVDSWKRIPHYRPLYTTVCHGVDPYKYNSCTDSQGMLGFFYSWLPDPPQKYHQFEPQQVCKMMQGRNILIVGDSLSEQFMTSFISGMLAHTVPSSRQKKASQGDVDAIYDRCKAYPCTMKHVFCENTWKIKCGSGGGSEYPPFHISFKFTKHLDLRVERDDMSVDAISWVEHIGRVNASLVIINTGAHKHENSSGFLTEGLDLARKLYPGNVSYIYRNSVPGHANCTELFSHRPLREEQDLTHYRPDSYFNWREFHPLNEKIKGILARDYPDIAYLDVYTSGALRADSHPGWHGAKDPDCLHYCQPGPIDTWVQLFYEAMVVLTDQEPPPFTDHEDRGLVPTRISQMETGEIVKHSRFTSRWLFYIANGTKHAISDLTGFLSVADGREFSDVKPSNSWVLLDYPTGRPLHTDENGARIVEEDEY